MTDESPSGMSQPASRVNGRTPVSCRSMGTSWPRMAAASRTPRAEKIFAVTRRRSCSGLLGRAAGTPSRACARCVQADRLGGRRTDPARDPLATRIRFGGGRVRNETLWRVPITGGAPVSTGLTLEGMRDISIHPDGRQIAFNAGWKRGEQWVMENLLIPNP